MIFKNLSVVGPKRTFAVDFINKVPNGLGHFVEGCSVKISSRVPDKLQPQLSNSTRLEVTNIAGIDRALEKLNDFLGEFGTDFAFPWAHRSGAVLLHGGHGSGKTFILNKIAASGWGKVYRVKRKDAKPATIEKVFKDAKLSQPSIIILDDLQNLVSKDDSVSQSVIETLEEELDGLYGQHSASLPKVLVAAATLESSTIPMSLKDISRFSTEIPLSIPDAPARKSILKSLAPPLSPEIRDEILEKLGDRTHAYTAKDLILLLSTAGKLAEKQVDRTVQGWKEKEYFLSQDNIEQALLLVRPTAMHDITLKPPSVKWDEIGGQEGVKKALRRAIETPLLVCYPYLPPWIKLIIHSILKE
jgi:AAA family ATPase